MRATYMHPVHVADFAAHGASTGGVVPVAVMVGLCLLGVLVALMVVLTRPPTDRQDGADGDSGPGGGGRGPGGGPPGGPSPEGGDPVCWPEFERQFADYVASTTRAGSRVGAAEPTGAGATP
jgi:hypothetical protein